MTGLIERTGLALSRRPGPNSSANGSDATADPIVAALPLAPKPREGFVVNGQVIERERRFGDDVVAALLDVDLEDPTSWPAEMCQAIEHQEYCPTVSGLGIEPTPDELRWETLVDAVVTRLSGRYALVSVLRSALCHRLRRSSLDQRLAFAVESETNALWNDTIRACLDLVPTLGDDNGGE